MTTSIGRLVLMVLLLTFRYVIGSCFLLPSGSFEGCEEAPEIMLNSLQVFEQDKDKTEHKAFKVKFQGGAIFLPSVAPQFGWNKEQTLQQLIKKAGFKGKV